jgi:hypothetical protein
LITARQGCRMLPVPGRVLLFFWRKICAEVEYIQEILKLVFLDGLERLSDGKGDIFEAAAYR